jgi:hypothetical protein
MKLCDILPRNFVGLYRHKMQRWLLVTFWAA